MTMTSDERTERVIELFGAAASGEKRPSDQEVFSALHDLALSVQEALRMADMLNGQLQELRHHLRLPTT